MSHVIDVCALSNRRMRSLSLFSPHLLVFPGPVAIQCGFKLCATPHLRPAVRCTELLCVCARAPPLLLLLLLLCLCCTGYATWPTHEPRRLAHWRSGRTCNSGRGVCCAVCASPSLLPSLSPSLSISPVALQ